MYSVAQAGQVTFMALPFHEARTMTWEGSAQVLEISMTSARSPAREALGLGRDLSMVLRLIGLSFEADFAEGQRAQAPRLSTPSGRPGNGGSADGEADEDRPSTPGTNIAASTARISSGENPRNVTVRCGRSSESS